MNRARARSQVYQNNYRARYMNVEAGLSLEEWLDILRAANGVCRYCKRFIGIDRLSLEHITPMSKGGGNVKENVTAVCYPCNCAKCNRDTVTVTPEFRPFITKTENLVYASDIATRLNMSGDTLRSWSKLGVYEIAGICDKNSRKLLVETSEVEKIEQYKKDYDEFKRWVKTL